ncbi:hypothetical protein ACCO45_003622 [Purpureocillium lilacinum]|uniref:Uncharacterized protein n=1 Tax=Purpureocillium lilacinum TaxID=33203 RepID=A0ACC4E2X9_PURLI
MLATILTCLAVAAGVASGSPAISARDDNTAGHVYARDEWRLIAINPKYETDFPHSSAGGANKRSGVFVAASLICSDIKQPNRGNFGYIKIGGITNAYEALQGLDGDPILNPGPRVCSDLTCKDSTQSSICNDNPAPINIHDWDLIANAIRYIRDRCGRIKGYDDRYYGGQVFHKDKWNLILKQKTCK